MVKAKCNDQAGEEGCYRCAKRWELRGAGLLSVRGGVGGVRLQDAGLRPTSRLLCHSTARSVRLAFRLPLLPPPPPAESGALPFPPPSPPFFFPLFSPLTGESSREGLRYPPFFSFFSIAGLIDRRVQTGLPSSPPPSPCSLSPLPSSSPLPTARTRSRP